MAKESISYEELDKFINQAYDQFIKDLNSSEERIHVMMLVDKHCANDPEIRRRLRTIVKVVYGKFVDRTIARMALQQFYEDLCEEFVTSIESMDGKFSLALHGAKDSKRLDPPIDRILKKVYGKAG